ncbi:hypothetical protein CY34DRAFT_377607 [Suillus luteus UH-Slu-Lm8-n1]|uniref:Uncharacterized protein n=1 Tax=Suillus luteus UH-Slu-Lm8-n1 TaxID=930992 RepID=A0A0D0AWB3_9AGAM|nr:hypothetical protein CY34DRAFT_377607 [Suillus luteus UH-Slu-Lm8-n1]
MDYFSKFLRATPQASPKPVQDHSAGFSRSWNVIKTILEHPDERQLTKGINSTDAPAHLQSMVDALVKESSHTEEGYVLCNHEGLDSVYYCSRSARRVLA